MNVNESKGILGWRHRLALAGVVLLGLASIVGSGGGSADLFGGEVCGGNSCAISIPTVQITPSRVTVQVAAAVRFEAFIANVNNPTYQWQRSNAGAAFVDIPGATATAYTLPSATLPDDGTLFRLEVLSGANVVATDSARLAVSSMPSVSFGDAEFLPADWTTAPVPDPLSGGATHVEGQVVSGGNPGAYRRITLSMASGPSDLTVVNLYRLGEYEPAVQGAIHVIDYSEDCLEIPVGPGTQFAASTKAAFQQGSRFYVAKPSFFCNSYAWSRHIYAALSVSDFMLLAGPPCAAAEACPDFSAAGAVLQLGFARSVALTAGTAAVTIDQGSDNWSVQVWRP